MKIFITGFHRAGTHSFAEHITEQKRADQKQLEWWDKGWLWVDESEFDFYDYEKAVSYPENHVVQCPGLAHRVLDLARHGDVIWADRDPRSIATSMVNGGLQNESWRAMNDFHDTFPDDGIWERISYNGKRDVHLRFVGHFTLLKKVKDYFYNKYFNGVAERLLLEEQGFYVEKKSLTYQKPLKRLEKEHYESISLDQT
ncbi:MAG: hypothetical protein GY757_18800 [bacterium]|nr:hypothetical protein [bacterium]